MTGSTTLAPQPLVNTRHDGGVLILTVNCESFSGWRAEEIASICLGYANPEMGGYARQAVSLGLVREVTCDGLRALVQVSDSLSAEGGKLIVFGAPQGVRSIVRRTGLRLTLARQGTREAVRLALGGDDGAYRLRLPFARRDAA